MPLVPRDRRMDPGALANFLHFGYVVHPRSWLEGVRQLLPGQYLVWCDGRLTIGSYFRWSYNPDEALGSPGSALAVLRERLEVAVRSHLVADVPLGSFLSGGLDSSTIAGIAQRYVGRPGLQAYTVQFGDPELDETARATAIAEELGVGHHIVSAQKLPFDRMFLTRFVAALGEPFGDTSALAMWLLCQAARPAVKVALSGDGGDELFLGYSGLRRQRLARRLRVGPAALRRSIAAALPSDGGEFARRLKKYLALSSCDDSDLVIEWARRWSPQSLTELLEPEALQQLYPDSSRPFGEVRDWFDRPEGTEFGERQLLFHLLVDLPCDCLFKVDRMSMAHGLEVRVPLLSTSMLEYASLLPLARREDHRRSKEPLRSLAETLAPTLRQPSPKRGFDFPLDGWMRPAAARYWREWGLTDVLIEFGFAKAGLDRLVDSYERLGKAAESFRSRTLSRQVFDLMLVGVWAQDAGVSGSRS